MTVYLHKDIYILNRNGGPLSPLERSNVELMQQIFSVFTVELEHLSHFDISQNFKEYTVRYLSVIYMDVLHAQTNKQSKMCLLEKPSYLIIGMISFFAYHRNVFCSMALNMLFICAKTV